MFNLDNKKVLILGLGKTGISVAKYILSQKWKTEIIVTDSKPLEKLPPEFQEIKDKIFKSTLGGHEKEDFDNADIIFVSPGVNLDKLPFVPAFEKEVINDIELAYRTTKANFIGITGSNGKSTTTKLIYEILKSKDHRTILGGNYGIPILDEVKSEKDLSNIVCELSSFQLENIAEFSPGITLFLNLSEDHLDRYPSYEEYIKAKERILANSTPASNIIFNLDDKPVSDIVNKYPGSKYSFSWTTDGDIYSDGKEIIVLNETLGKQSFSLTPFKLKGTHHTENLMAAILTALLCKVDRKTIEEIISTFSGIPHRTEFIREINGVSFYNDSKATNTGATVKAIEGFSDIILIAGGKDKGGSLDDLKEPIKNRVKLLVLIGEATGRFYSELGDLTNCIKCKDFEEAVSKSWENSKPGDNILLSPACSSYDMFKNFEVRGDHFRKLVEEL